MVRVVFVRHSETFFNVEKKATKPKIADKSKRNGYFQSLRNFDFVDSDLTPQGIEVTRQAIKDNQATLAKIKWVVVSPMIRALHTAEFLFDFANIKSGLQVVVHPALRTKLTTIYNVPFKYLTQRDRFAGLDWTLVDQRLRQFGWGWFTQELHTDQHRQALGKITADNSNLPLDKQVIAVLDYMEKIYPGYSETRKEKFLKMVEFQVWLASFIQQNGVKDDELCVVSHSSTLKMLAAGAFDGEFLPIKTTKMGNTEFVIKDIYDTFLYKYSISEEGQKELAEARHKLTQAWATEGRLLPGAEATPQQPVTHGTQAPATLPKTE